MAYYKDLWDYAAKLCHLPVWTYNSSTFAFTSNQNHAETIRQGFNECIGRIAKERYSPKVEDEMYIFTSDSYYVDLSKLVKNPYNIINIKTDIQETGDKLNWKHSRDLGQDNTQLRLDKEYKDDDILYIDYTFIPDDIPLLYDGTTLNFPFPSNIVDWRMIVYYAVSNWYLLEGGEEDIKISIFYGNKFQEMFDKIKNPLNDATKTFQRGSIW